MNLGEHNGTLLCREVTETIGPPSASRKYVSLVSNVKISITIEGAMGSSAKYEQAIILMDELAEKVAKNALNS